MRTNLLLLDSVLGVEIDPSQYLSGLNGAMAAASGGNWALRDVNVHNL